MRTNNYLTEAYCPDVRSRNQRSIDISGARNSSDLLNQNRQADTFLIMERQRKGQGDRFQPGVKWLIGPILDSLRAVKDGVEIDFFDAHRFFHLTLQKTGEWFKATNPGTILNFGRMISNLDFHKTSNKSNNLYKIRLDKSSHIPAWNILKVLGKVDYKGNYSLLSPGNTANG